MLTWEDPSIVDGAVPYVGGLGLCEWRRGLSGSMHAFILSALHSGCF